MDHWCCGLFFVIEPSIKECQKTKKTHRQFMHKSFFSFTKYFFDCYNLFFGLICLFFYQNSLSSRHENEL